jgi:hypothetical protein
LVVNKLVNEIVMAINLITINRFNSINRLIYQIIQIIVVVNTIIQESINDLQLSLKFFVAFPSTFKKILVMFIFQHMPMSLSLKTKIDHKNYNNMPNLTKGTSLFIYF